MSIPVFIDQWVWDKFGKCFEELSLRDKKYYTQKYNEAPLSETLFPAGGYDRANNSITIIRRGLIVYTKPSVIKKRRKLYGYPKALKHGHLVDGVIYCNRHVCYHGTAYACEFLKAKEIL